MKKQIWTEFGLFLERMCGKVYNRDINSAFEKIKESNIEFSSAELNAIRLLMADLKQIEHKSNQVNKHKFF